MSHFYGGVRGGRGEATRCGSKRAGIQAYAKSWVTCVKVHYDYNEGVDSIRIVARDINSDSSKVLWKGTETDLLRLIQEK